MHMKPATEDDQGLGKRGVDATSRRTSLSTPPPHTHTASMVSLGAPRRVTCGRSYLLTPTFRTGPPGIMGLVTSLGKIQTKERAGISPVLVN